MTAAERETIYPARPDDPFSLSTLPSPPRPEPTLAAALESLAASFAGDSRDWGVYYRDAWCYGIVCGWDCEDDHQHDRLCNNGAAMAELAQQHGWSDEDVAWLRAARAAFRAVEESRRG